jgi:tungstate transport system ATP-binding protein
MEEPVLKVRNLTRHYGGEFTLEIHSLEFHAGKVYSLVGPNGAGKTTLLEVLSLLVKPNPGEIIFSNREITNSDILSARRQMMLIAQDPYLFHTTVFNNVAYGLKIRSVDRNMIQEKVSQSLRTVGLSGFENRKAYQLSAGEAQRVAIAQALVLDLEILFLDEPTANIDKTNTKIVEQLIGDINRRNSTTIIFTTHNISQAYGLSDEVLFLLNGKIVDATPDNLFMGDIEEANGLKYISISDRVKVTIATEKTGKAYISIKPEDIILSRQPIESSARNSFSGKITKTADKGMLAMLYVDVDVEFAVLVTKKSFEELGLNLGSRVYLTFKTSAVQVF